MADSPTLDSLDDDADPDLRACAAQPAFAGPKDVTSGSATTAHIEGLYRSHFGKVCGYFRRCGETEAVAHELAQDTFIQALRGCAQFDGRSQLSTWLWAIARNTLLGHLRRQGRRVAGDDARAAAPVDPDTLSSARSGRQMEQDACVRRGFAAFAQDHPDRAQVIYLAAVEGWTREELATHLGRTPHAATEYLSQCRAKLRPYIEGCDGDC
jgi:RNA polymerase sigma-70 factor (ECF subfamily)